ncbi:MAG: flagellar motor switch phosphatase FliY, partial [Firmicutes bacterium]|nr:flagellar motor switch phosphatase FliY [Bacillota bacterium]
MSSRLLRQEEIDALLEQYAHEEPETPELTAQEKDALGEIGNISMGSAATTLSTLLGRRVSITSPQVETTAREALFTRFTVPYLAVEVNFTEGLAGSNLLIVREADAQVIADVMMGGDGSSPTGTLDEMQTSAAAEAMNQMIGAAATAMANLFGRRVAISPPQARVIRTPSEAAEEILSLEDPVVAVSFRMTIEGLVDTTIIQAMGLETAREEAGLLLQMAGAAGGAAEAAPAGVPAAAAGEAAAGADEAEAA